ncbi:MAG TPA: hypothetical protein VKU41_01380 [Polyangiaceae bacterium]|nr:hypothetical protein [Polyangiaceae bacterium]
MADERVLDLGRLDADVARAFRAVSRWRVELAADPTLHVEDDPFDGLRHTAGKSTWDALGALTPSAAETPLRDALRYWVRWLIGVRVGGPDDVGWAAAAAEPVAYWAGEEPKLVSWRECWRGAAQARKAGEARLWIEAAAGAATPLAHVAATRASRRLELARRLGLEHPWEGPARPAPEALRSAARGILDATEDVSRAVWREALGRDFDAADVIHSAVAREAAEGWPARLTARWFDEAFRGGARGLRVALPSLPRATGASSFARALVAFGFAVRAATARAVPFALGREPDAISAHRLGWVFGALASDEAFFVRSLGVGVRRAAAQARLLARTALLETRLTAARVLLGDDARFAARDLFEEVVPRVFGSPLAPSLRGAWPTCREDEPSRFLALLETPRLRGALRDHFDVDWFVNPRAWAHLRAQGPVAAGERIPDADIGAAVVDVARAFEAALA